ncbi:hypothetical protein Pelsub_P2564 [Pelolinea submarina]|nr:hypothetical protein Pelsub_P2564 [Pelolinea submarina]
MRLTEMAVFELASYKINLLQLDTVCIQGIKRQGFINCIVSYIHCYSFSGSKKV